MRRSVRRARGLVAIERLPAFLAFLVAGGWRSTRTVAEEEVLRVVRGAEVLRFTRRRGARHLTTWGAGLDLARRFVNVDKRRARRA